MTFAIGRRFIIVDGVERWKEKELEPIIEAAGRSCQPDTTVAFFAREEGRAQGPGGAPRRGAARPGATSPPKTSVKPWELPKWVMARARELGLELEPDAARALIGHVGDRQQRLLRELEKLALGAGPGSAALDADEIEELTRVLGRAQGLVAGRCAARRRCRPRRPDCSWRCASRESGCRGLLYWMGSRIRQAHDVAVALDAGEPPAQIKRNLRMPSKAADRLIADAGRAGSDRLRAAIEQIADLELASRGGAPGRAQRGHGDAADDSARSAA